MADATILTQLTIWDGNRLLAADAIKIAQGRITWLGQSSDLSDRDRSHAQDAHGLTLIPGLIDAHVHLELDPNEHKPPARTEERVIPHMAERAAAMVKAGITTARDLGGGAWFELSLRDQIARGEKIGPRLICSGQPITCPQGHCHFWGGEAADEAEAKSVLQRQLDQGVDLIKIMATGGRLTAGSEPTDTQFPTEVIAALVTMAHDNQRHVAAHCHGTAGIKAAALAGVDTIEHCSWVGKEGWASDYQPQVADLILDSGAWVSPTVNKGWQRMLDSKTGNVLARVRSAYRQMIDLGIPMLASTDAGIPGVFHHELPQALNVFAQIAELTPTEALKSATSDAARALGLDKQVGTIAEGMAADFILCHGDPLTDLTNLAEPAQVYAAGQALA